MKTIGLNRKEFLMIIDALMDKIGQNNKEIDRITNHRNLFPEEYTREINETSEIRIAMLNGESRAIRKLIRELEL